MGSTAVFFLSTVGVLKAAAALEDFSLSIQDYADCLTSLCPPSRSEVPQAEALDKQPGLDSCWPASVLLLSLHRWQMVSWFLRRPEPFSSLAPLPAGLSSFEPSLVLISWFNFKKRNFILVLNH